jgi:hypothetical protein
MKGDGNGIAAEDTGPWAAVVEAGRRMEARAEAKLRRQSRDFVMVPIAWVDQLAKAERAVTYRLALHLLYRAWRTRNYDDLAVSNIAAARSGVSPRSKSNGLAELEQLGLVAVTRHPKRAPTVRLLKVPRST